MMSDKNDVTPQVDETPTEPVKMDAKTKESVKELKVEVSKTIEKLVEEVIRGAHGTGRERMLSLGDQYEAVQHEVNQLIKKGVVRG
jgi:hypothetical protein